jgi:sugar/nucleoside kinase (ribokinase family)
MRSACVTSKQLSANGCQLSILMFIVCAGGLRIDYLITHDGEAFCGLPGGNALYAAAGARLWADNVGLWARYGRNYPTSWLDKLSDMGLDTGGLISLEADQDHRTFFAYTPGGNRDDTRPADHFARIGQPLPPELSDYIHSTPQQDDPTIFEPLALRPEDWPLAYDSETAVHLAPLPLATHLSAPARLREAGVKIISVDPGERYMIPERVPFLKQLLPQVDAFLPSDQEVRSLLGNDIDLWEAAEQLAAWGALLVVIKIGADGILLFDTFNEQHQHLPAYHEPGSPGIVDVTGAGDSFCGGFLAGLAQYGDALQAAQMGLVSASMIIEGYGAINALNLNLKEAQTRLLEISLP